MERIFWTPLLTEKIDDSEKLNAALEPLIRHKQRHGPARAGAHVGAWHSDYQLFKWGGRAAAIVRDRAIDIANRHCRDIRSERRKNPRWIATGWANIFEVGDFTMPHAHGGAYWSAIYYVCGASRSGGELTIHDPRRPAIDMHAPHLRFEPSGGEDVIQIDPEPGTLVVMPGWLSHSVTRWEGPGERISIAFNLSCPHPRS